MMATMPEPVFTARIELVKELGWDPFEVTRDVTPTHFTVVGAHPELGDVLYGNNEVLRTSIPWPEEYRARAEQAFAEDWDAMFGAGSYALISKRPE